MSYWNVYSTTRSFNMVYVVDTDIPDKYLLELFSLIQPNDTFQQIKKTSIPYNSLLFRICLRTIIKDAKKNNPAKSKFFQKLKQYDTKYINTR